jgi:hypothetical protein
MKLQVFFLHSTTGRRIGRRLVTEAQQSSIFIVVTYNMIRCSHRGSILWMYWQVTNFMLSYDKRKDENFQSWKHFFIKHKRELSGTRGYYTPSCQLKCFRKTRWNTRILHTSAQSYNMDITHHVSKRTIWILHTIWPKIPPMNDVTHEHRFFSHESILQTIMRFCSKLKKTRWGYSFVDVVACELAGPLTGCNSCSCFHSYHFFPLITFCFNNIFIMLPQNGCMPILTSTTHCLHTIITRT